MRVFACLLSRLFYNMRACFYDENRGRREDKKGVTRGKAGKKKRFFPARAKVLRFFLSDLFLERVSLSLSLSLSLSFSLSLSLSQRCGTEHRLVIDFGVCRLDSGCLTRRVNTRGGCFREQRRKSKNPKARHFRAST